MAIFERPIQVIAVIIAIFAISRAVLRWRERKLTLNAFLFWTLLWVGAVVIAFVPWLTFFFSGLVGIERGIDLIIYLSIIALFYLVFRIYIKLEDVEQEITKVVREVALKKGKK